MKQQSVYYQWPNGYIWLMRYLVVFFVLLSFSGFAQNPLNAIVLGGPGQHVNFGEVLENTRTISFWIKLTTAIDSTNPIESPVLVRDVTDPQNFYTGEFAIYFGKSGTPGAGHLVFTRATVLAPFTIVSDANQWAADQWYHVAAVLHPQNGMQMFINGILQQDVNSSTDPIYMRSEGNTGSLMLGKWGNVSGYGLRAELDELRFYSVAKTQAEIRNSMCQVENASAAGLTHYYRFDAATNVSVPPYVGTISGSGVNIPANGIVTSNAPVGDISVNEYNIQSSTTLSLLQSAEFVVEDIVTPAEGMHLYATNDPNNFGQGILSTFFGVWFTSPSAEYKATIDFNSLVSVCDSCNRLETRDYQTDAWKPRAQNGVNCQYVMPSESPGKLDYREEYMLLYELQLKSGLPDTITECEYNFAYIVPTQFPGATFLWENGETVGQRKVDSAGTYWLRMRWNGCEIYDTVVVIFEPTPYFELPNDTAICIGDTLILEGPDMPGAIYNWGGLAFGRTYRMYQEGTMILTVTVGNCSWSDEIKVDIIRSFPLNLGRDTTLCLGQEYTVRAPKNVDFIWSDGSSDQSITVFNMPRKIWIEAWNECFTKVDTVDITYEECDCHIYMANSFTPNNDDVNDVFQPVTSCYYEEFELMIFDRWGAMVFHSTNQNEVWDGTRNGKKLPEGVYSYQMRYKKYTQYKIGEYERGMITLMY